MSDRVAANMWAKKNVSKTSVKRPQVSAEERVFCDRCSRPMFRMRAVYWCDHCGYKTDCCGS